METQHPHRHHRTLSRRGMIRLVALGTASVAASSLLAACGSSTATAPTPTAGGQATAAGSAPTPAGNAQTTGQTAPTAAAVNPGSAVAGGGTSAPSANLPGKALTIRNRGEIVNLDPHLASGNPAGAVGHHIDS